MSANRLTMAQFIESFFAVSGEYPRAGDWYYHEECAAAGAPCSVHETARGYLKVPVDGSGPSMHAEDIRGQDRPAPDWGHMVCPQCGADSVIRDPQEGPVQYPEVWSAPVGCSCCGWEGSAAETNYRS